MIRFKHIGIVEKSRKEVIVLKLRMNICDVDLWFEIYNYKKPRNTTEEYCMKKKLQVL